MKRVAPIMLGLAVLAAAKKKAMMAHGHDGSHHQRRQRWEERTRAWHQREHEHFEA
jgi:hypothetical protein